MESGEDERRTMTVELRVIVSYNVERRRASEISMVYQFVFGRKVSKKLASGRKVYRYAGLIDREEAEVLGQSVVMLREKDADGFTSFLWDMRVPYTAKRIWVES